MVAQVLEEILQGSKVHPEVDIQAYLLEALHWQFQAVEVEPRLDMTVGELQVVAVVQTKAEPHLQVLLWEDAEVRSLPAVRKQQVVQLMDLNTQAVPVAARVLKVAAVVELVITVVAAETQTALQMAVVVADRDISTQPAVH
jgi:hypothetical protein